MSRFASLESRERKMSGGEMIKIGRRWKRKGFDRVKEDSFELRGLPLVTVYQIAGVASKGM